MAALIKRAGQPHPWLHRKQHPPATQSSRQRQFSGASRRKPQHPAFVKHSAQDRTGQHWRASSAGQPITISAIAHSHYRSSLEPWSTLTTFARSHIRWTASETGYSLPGWCAALHCAMRDLSPEGARRSRKPSRLLKSSADRSTCCRHWITTPGSRGISATISMRSLRRQGAPLFEPRAAIVQAKLLERQQRFMEGRTALEEVLRKFADVSGSPYLDEARSLIRELTPGQASGS